MLNKKIAEKIDGKSIILFGGTGSIGKELLYYIVNNFKPREILIFSRDEYKQYQLKSTINTKITIKYIIGDIRDYASVSYYTKNIDIIFHCAALKHVPISEENPEEFIRTNILGSINIKNAALENNVTNVVSVSTDKAVYPSNVMGFTKAIQEKIFTAQSYTKRQNQKTKMVNVRFGNVIDTKGSLFPIMYHQIMNNLPLTLTDERMTRFFMTKADAARLILSGLIYGNDGDTLVKKMKAVNISTLQKKFIEAMNKPVTYPVKIIGIRPGEKIDELLVTNEELPKIELIEDIICIRNFELQEIEENKIIYNTYNHSLDSYSSINSHFNDDELLIMIKEYIKGQVNIQKDFI